MKTRADPTCAHNDEQKNLHIKTNVLFLNAHQLTCIKYDLDQMRQNVTV